LRYKLAIHLILIAICSIAFSTPGWGGEPVPILQGEYRLGDSPQTPEEGLAWLTVDTDSPSWMVFPTDQGHPVEEFTNVWRRFRLREDVFPDATLYVTGWPSFEAYLDGILIYRVGSLYPDPKNKLVHHSWHLIPLPSGYSGKTLYFRMYSAHPDAYWDRVSPSVASRSDHLIDMVRRELAQTTAGLFLIIIGCGATFVFVRRGFQPALSLGFFAISIGAISALHTEIAPMLFEPSVFWWYATHIPLYTFPVGLWMFLNDITDREYPILARLWQVQALYGTGALVADILGYYPMLMTDLYLGILSISILIAVYVTFLNLYRQKRRPETDQTEAKLLGAGFALLILSGTHDILAGLNMIPFSAPLFPFGVLLFSVSLVILLERRFAQAHDQLRSYSRDLEKRVDERTHDLGVKNTALEHAMDELKEAQHQLIMREKMASLGDLVAGIAHEVNTPIGAVSSSADVAERCVDKLSRIIDHAPGTEALRQEKNYRQAFELLKDNTGLIKNAADRIARIVRSLRSFARLDEAEFQTVSIQEGIDSTLDLVNHQIKGKVDIIKNYGADVPPIECFPNRLNQVFMNLLVNAAQSIEETGMITITTELKGSDVVVSVQDTGKGISNENIKHIFDPGFTTKGVGVGTGLGLSISYKIIEDHGGSIEVDSAPGVGSVFRLFLPIRQADLADPKPISSGNSNGF